MEYQEILYDIFEKRGPKSLRTLFDVDSKEWHDTNLDIKAKFLTKMLEKKPIDYWTTQYKLQYQSTHPHVIKFIDKSIEVIQNHIKTKQAVKKTDLDLVVEKVLNDIKIETELGEEYFYSNIAFCVIDSIFSIGVRYGGVQNVIKNVASKLNIRPSAIFKDGIRQDEITTSEFLTLIKDWTSEEAAIELYKNNQRTSTSNGILKAAAVRQFLEVLKDHKVEGFKDIDKVFGNNIFEADIKSIKGQSSGISLKYFYMLAGNGDLIKPDRMIMRFIEDTVKHSISVDDAQALLFEAASTISNRLGLKINAMLLDNHIWKYQRQK